METTLKPYPEYQETGHEWLGHVPAHWQVFPNRALFHEVKDQNHPDEPLLSVTISRGVIPQDALLSGSSKKDSSNLDKSKYKLAQPGDIAYNKMRAWQGSLGVSEHRGIVSPAYVVVRPRQEIDPRFYHYLLRSPAFVKEAERWSYGITSDMWSLRYEDFKQIYCVLPPLDEQRRIARYLDQQNRRANRLIRAKQRLIALLNEQKQAIIQRAVTRGLDPDVKLKPSGVDWLGDVPAHWEVLPMKRVLRRLVDCEHKTAPAVETSSYVVARTSSIKEGKYRPKGSYFTSDVGFQEWTKREVPRPGDILFTREAPAGEACLVPSGINLCMGQRVVLLRVDAKKYDPNFALLMIYGGPPAEYVRMQSQGSTVPHFNMSDIAAMIVYVPPLEEQAEIVGQVHEHTRKLDQTIERALSEINLIREYRTRLITDVVTGKLDVRGVAVPEDDIDIDDMQEAVDIDDDALVSVEDADIDD